MTEWTQLELRPMSGENHTPSGQNHLLCLIQTFDSVEKMELSVTVYSSFS